jgi:hypothetical protein
MLIRIFAGGSQWGLGHDSRVVTAAFRSSGASIEYCDPITWLPASGSRPADIHIYLEQPCRLAIASARLNVMVVNPEWFPATAWNWCAAEMDLFVFKTRAAARLFTDVPLAKKIVIPWRSDMPIDFGTWVSKESRFLYVIGGSINKAIAARDIVRTWRPEWPPLEIWCAPAIAAHLAAEATTATNIFFQTEYRSAAEREARQRSCAWHVVASAAEGYGFTMAEAVACGAPVLWTDLPVYRESWACLLGPGGARALTSDVGRIDMIPMPPAEIPVITGTHDLYRQPMREGKLAAASGAAIEAAVHSLLAVNPSHVERIQQKYREQRTRAFKGFREGWQRVLDMEVPRGAGGAAGIQTQTPKVCVITLTRNRAAWWLNMSENIRRTAAILEWVIVDDSDDRAYLEREVKRFATTVPVTVRYLGVPAGTSIGAKRNAAVAAAAPDCSVFCIMDDDDHYPAASVETRVSALVSKRVGATYCSTLPMYDLRRYISAINVPPLTCSPAERVSEATLCFTREFWTARPFPEVSMAEGEGFITGRESETAEISPLGVIVSFIHKGNSSSRRVPADQEPNGCHYGFSDEYFKYLHEIGS